MSGSNDLTHYDGTFRVRDDARFALVASRFNHFIVDRLVEGAVDAFVRHGISKDRLVLVQVPGAYELPWAAGRVARSGKVAAVVALGAVIRGATPHFDHVAGSAASGLSQVMAETKVPVALGVLTTDTIEQAIERAGTKAGNKGWEAALTAIELVSLGEVLSRDGF